MHDERYRPWRTVSPDEFETVIEWRLALLRHEAAMLEHTATAYSAATPVRSVIGRAANADAPMQALIDSTRNAAA